MTIIVLLVLSGTVISMLTGEDGILIQAQETKFKSELSSLKDEYMLFINNKKLESPIQFKEESVWASKNSLTYNTKTEENGNIEDVLPSISKSLKEKIEIVKGKLLIKTQNKREVEWAEQIGVEVNPYEITEDGVLVSSNGNLLLIDEEGTLELPDTITEIGEGTFANVEGLKTIIIPGSVKTIGVNAFANNKSLEKVIIEDGVKIIGANAFTDCYNLKEIQIPESVDSIGFKAMYCCTNLNNIILPSTITTIEQYTFALCSNLKNIELPDNLETIKENAFSNCKSLEDIIIHSKVKSISPEAFASCNKLANIEIDSDNQAFSFSDGMLMNKSETEIYFMIEKILTESDTLNIPEGVEKFQNSITSYRNIKKIIFPKSLKEIGRANFPYSITSIEIIGENESFCVENNCLYSIDKKKLYYCFSSQEDITLDEGVEIILEGSFKTAINAKNITLPDSVTTIEDKVFINNLTSLEKIYIGKNVTSISSLFKYQNYLGTVTIDEENPNYMVNDNIMYSKDGKTIVTILKLIEGNFEVDSNVEEIAAYAFYSQNKMTSIKLPEGLQVIRIQAFGYCKELTSIEIPSKVTSIGKNCFIESNKLVEIIINNKEGSISGAPWSCKYGMKAIKWQE